MPRPVPIIPTIPRMKKSIFSKITPTVLSKPYQATPTPIPPDIEMRVPKHHNIGTHASDVRVQDSTRLWPPMIPKSIPNHPTPPPHHTMTQPLVLGLLPQISHAKLPTSSVNLVTPIPLIHQPKETSHRYTTIFGLAIHHIANKVNNERYKHHIAVLVTPPEAGKQPSLGKLLKGPDIELWDKSNKN